jgi:hypothetical protein
MRAKFDYSAGEVVRIKSGAFQCFTEPIELRFLDVEKMTFTEEE